MKKLPIGMYTFEKLIKGGHVYADKTRYVYELVQTEGAFFLSRPRRFGKSLLLSTFESLFSGPPEPDGTPQGLFKDLWIGQSDYDFSQKFPVVCLDMALNSSTPEVLNAEIEDMLLKRAKPFGVEIDGPTPGSMLESLINCLADKYNTKVVLLIDEYDSPVSDNIDNIALVLKIRDILKSFYSKLKSCDKQLRFVFVTGVTRYAFMGLSSGLNHLNDITLTQKYAGICGFTQDEFKTCFSDHLEVALEGMRGMDPVPADATVADLADCFNKWYDGYSWDGKTRVLNPFSILKCLEKTAFSNYWIQTNPSGSFLSKIAARNPLALLGDEAEKISEEILGLAEVGSLGPVPALFQTGYLTVDKVTAFDGGGTAFTMKIPNLEIKRTNIPLFVDSIYSLLGCDPATERDTFKNAIMARDQARLTEIIDSVFAGLPAEHHANNESCYHKVLYGYCHKFGRIVIPERKGAIGNSDLVVILPGRLYAVIELKFDAGDETPKQVRLVSRLALEALEAIEKKDYWRPFQSEANELVKIGLGVSYRGQCQARIGD
ncbi:MAG: ATP-binding protein [Deltaproteobacteria bacterium]|jgi:hypothetical protein|nr:ATP-binding protein [Deltaproteobacteria bacterium]